MKVKLFIQQQQQKTKYDSNRNNDEMVLLIRIW